MNLLDILLLFRHDLIYLQIFFFNFKSLHSYSKKFHLLFSSTDIRMSIFRTLALIPKGEKTKQSEHDRPYKHPWSPFVATALVVLIELSCKSKVSHSSF